MIQTRRSSTSKQTPSEKKAAQQEQTSLDDDGIPKFLKNDPAEAEAYLKVQMLGKVLDTTGDGLSQEDVRTYVMSQMVENQVESDKGLVPQSPGSLITHGLSPRLNVVFDVDHTLIYACARQDSRIKPGTLKNTHLLKLNNGFEMILIVREGVYEMLEYLAPFCTFFVYSHGLREYIERILDIIDPHHKWFLNREERVLAPNDQFQQKYFKDNGKSFRDFKKKDNKMEPLLSQADLERTIIIDDQFMAINRNDRDCLIQSKKFLRYFDCLVTKQKQLEVRSYQYPISYPDECHIFQNSADEAFSFFDKNLCNDDNQVFHFCQILTRVFLTRFLTISATSRPQSVSQILAEFRLNIFKGYKFSFEDWDAQAGGIKGHNGEEQDMEITCKMRDVCMGIVRQFGGEILGDGNKFVATHWVHYRRPDRDEQFGFCPPTIHRVHFTYITECFFANGQKDISKFKF